MKRARLFGNLKPEDMKKLAVLELYPRTDLCWEFYRKTFAAFAFGKWYQPRNQKRKLLKNKNKTISHPFYSMGSTPGLVQHAQEAHQPSIQHGMAFQDWCEHLGVVTDAGTAVEGIQAGTKRSPHGCDRPWKGGLHEQGSKDGM